MASAEDQALKILERQVADLTAQLQTLTSERDEYRDALTEVSNDRDSLKSQIAEPGDMAKELATLKAQIRDRTHFDKFAELAKGEKANEKALKTLWREAQANGYKVEGDEPDEAAIKGIVAKLKAEADYAFTAPEPPNMAAARAAATTPPGGARGARHGEGDGVQTTADMLADPRYMLTGGQAAIAARVRDRQAASNGLIMRDR